MSTLLPLPLLESLGIQLVQQAADAAFGPGVLTVSSDDNGISAGFTLSAGQVVNLDNLQLQNGVFSGHLWIDKLSANPLSATIGDGFTIALTAFDLTLANSGLAASNIAGSLTLPFFTDQNGNPQKIDVDVSTKANGDIAITVSADQSASGQTSTPDGLIQLNCPLPSSLGSIEIDVDSLSIDKSSAGVWTITISGNLIITTPDLNWPTIELQGLSIDSQGHITLAGGWINLPNQMALDFYGFHLGLQQLGFGTDSAGDKWIGFSGDIQLVEGLTLGGSVRGLQINLTTGALSLDGVGISFEIPGVLSIEGEIDHIHVNAQTPTDLENAGLNPSIFNAINPYGPLPLPPGYPNGKQVNLFAGQVKVNIEVCQLEVDANFIVGNFGGQSVFFLDLDVELPVGIPLFLDVSLWGLQGLVASGLEPQPEPTNTWWQWFQYPAVTNFSSTSATAGSVDTSGTPDYTASDFDKWLNPVSGAFALGVGATIGTEADDGFTASAAIMLVVMMPGPVISLIGMANILSKRITGASEGGNFTAMATYDGNSETFDLTIQAQYSIPVVLDIEATAELYVTANPAPGTDAWFFALGKPPHEKRVSARIFDLFESDSYFVISDHGLVVGTWTGYKNSWSFGPLSASIDVYLATMAAVQWSPLQIGAGIELHGNVQLSAFGIGIGLTADALLEGCAPNPFWIHGDLSVELDLPWPLPNIGATISLSWGGDNGTVPPAPLALSHLDATLSDHCDKADKPATDHYLLLSHKAGGFNPDLTAANVRLVYDPTNPGTPGILNLTGDSLTDWQNNRQNPATALPELVPDNTSSAQFAPIVPQDAHFVLNFSHPTVDGTGAFPASAIGWNSTNPKFPKDEDVVPGIPNAPNLGKDDMSNISLTPPGVQFYIRHTLTQVTLFQYDKGTSTWNPVCAVPPAPNPTPDIGVTQLDGVWLSGDPAKANQNQVMTQLKLIPWRLLPGQSWTASWNGQSKPVLGPTFTDQNLVISVSSGMAAPSIAGSSGFPPGLDFSAPSINSGSQVTITFPQPAVVTQVVAVAYTEDGEIDFTSAPNCIGDGTPLTVQSSSQDPTTQVYTLDFPQDGTPITQLVLPVDGNLLILYALDYTSAPVPMAILPAAPALYSLMTVTQVESERVGASSYQTVTNGSPIIELAYFQTATGPALAETAPPQPPSQLPVPVEPAPFPQLSHNCLAPANPSAAVPPSSSQQPNAAFPMGGALSDLTTYTQWSWPQDGATAAYYGYDLNFEFVESYVNALYMAFTDGTIGDSLHFRCVDANNLHTLVVPVAIHVPSIPQQSALVGTAILVPLAQPIQPPPPPQQQPANPIHAPFQIGNYPLLLSPPLINALKKRANVPIEDSADQPTPIPDFLKSPGSLTSIIQNLNLGGRFGNLNIQQIDPGLAGELLHQLQEEKAATTATAEWFQPLKPRTRYTLDVVAGPWYRRSDLGIVAEGNPSAASIAAIFEATDAIAVLKTLTAYFKYEDSLTTLKRVQFTTSRYIAFTAQLLNAAEQLFGTPGATPIRQYVAPVTPTAWLATVPTQVQDWVNKATTYITDHASLVGSVAQFSPLADDLQPGITPASNGAAALVQDRKQAASDWSAFSATVNSLYDGLIIALGHGELASGKPPIAVPDTEISFFTDASGHYVQALLVESPEPFPWQRIWLWIGLANSSGIVPLFPLWSADGTRALLFPATNLTGAYDLGMIFQGNLGPELPCITVDGKPWTEPVVVGPILMGKKPIRWPPLHPIGKEPILETPAGGQDIDKDALETSINSLGTDLPAEFLKILRSAVNPAP